MINSEIGVLLESIDNLWFVLLLLMNETQYLNKSFYNIQLN